MSIDERNSWGPVDPETKKHLIELARSGRAILSPEMTKEIGRQQLNDLLATVDDVSELAAQHEPVSAIENFGSTQRRDTTGTIG